MRGYKLDSAPGREIIIDKEAYLYFGGTSYLGLQTCVNFQDILIDAIKTYGTNHGASRKANIQFGVYDAAEKLLSVNCKAEQAVTLSSGFLVGQLVARYFNTDNYECYYAPKTHTALHLSDSFNHPNYDQLVEAIKYSAKTPVIFCDSIDFYGANYPDFKWLDRIDLTNTILVVDDSHGIGLLGDNGEGIYHYLSHLRVKELVVCASLGKGFGLQGGVILGKEKTINEIKKSDWYAGSSPISPAFMATYINAQVIYKERLQKLKNHIQLFKDELIRTSMFRYMPNYPTYSFQDEGLINHLYESRVIITNFQYPNEHAPTVHRIVLSAHHTTNDIKKITAIINDYYG
ncbi:aminotransferase class I/II-fold pyridoxal phosphate-dependent enzyme [Spongiivirga sp. MCCC 1A20706]|uniref:aminotransferase class I/II-fold pyridoxal phosphate-dependent enzyme n=1 Tax=Spongiivirga sp. MCCC 1A20706 TaxID=3160963 RepID=UPI0039775E0B